MRKLSAIITLIIGLLFFIKSGYAQCPANTTVNLIQNGDFESCVIGTAANDHFSTGYTYYGSTTCPGGYSSGAMSPNNYTVVAGTAGVSDAHAANTGYYTDPTGNPGSSPGGHYLIVDVDGTAGKSTYTTTVNVTAGSIYFLSAWMADINATFNNAPILKFTINGTQVGSTINVDPNANSNAWEQFYATWVAPTTGAITINIENERLTSNGNDLALDNIILFWNFNKKWL